MKFISIILLGIIGFFIYFHLIFEETKISAQIFTIQQGDTIASIPKKVWLDISPLLFKIYTRFFIPETKLLSGTYTIKSPITLKELFSDTLQNPTSKDISITILPGWNIWDIDAYLAKAWIITPGDFSSIGERIPNNLEKIYPFLSEAKSLEWFLVPDTYRIHPNSWAKEIVDLLLKTFNDRVYKNFTFSSDAELYKILIFASIVEKEEKSTVNKPIVAGILQKRFNEGMAIWADATVCYAYKLTMDKCTPLFIGDHIYEKSPYNTRNNTKMIPSPIANPSVETIRATMQKETSPYYYYLHDDTGDIHYGRTLEEHNNNKVRYLGK